MSEGYLILKFIHVASVILWLGSAFGFELLAHLVKRAGGVEELVQATVRIEWFGKYLYPPLSIIVLLTGIGMASMVWGFKPVWVQIGFGGIVLTIAIGIGYLSRKLIKIKALVEAQGPRSAEVLSNIDQLLLVARLDLLVLFLVVLDMVVKPGS